MQSEVLKPVDDEGVAMDFRSELEALINRYSKENGSDTPDFILAGFLINCLAAFDSAVCLREDWHGRGKRGDTGDLTGGEMDDRMIINRAKAINTMGLVERDYDGFNVVEPGIKRETFRIYRDEQGRVRCTCPKFEEEIKRVPIFRCEHILAVKFHLEPAEAAPAPAQPEGSPISKTMADLVTPKQLRAITAIANAKRINAEAECQATLNCRPEELSRRAASGFIDHLRSKTEQPR
jgi:hypothetical protein